MFIQYRF